MWREGLLGPPVSDAYALTHRPSPALQSNTSTEGPQASPSAKLAQLGPPRALSPPARPELPAPLKVGTTSGAATSSQAGRKSPPVCSGASRASAGSRPKPEAPPLKGKSSPGAEVGWALPGLWFCSDFRVPAWRLGSPALSVCPLYLLDHSLVFALSPLCLTQVSGRPMFLGWRGFMVTVSHPPASQALLAEAPWPRSSASLSLVTTPGCP